jgi:hypothetical protein
MASRWAISHVESRRERPLLWLLVDLVAGVAMTVLLWMVINRTWGIVFACLWAALIVAGLLASARPRDTAQK